jgi:uncharacterized protein (TIGR00730 family)
MATPFASAAVADGAAPPQPLPPRRRTAVVFGASWAVRGDALFAEAFELGRRLAGAGFRVVSGGYGGTMEAVSEGAASVPGAQVEGVIVSALFPGRPGNAFLTSTVDAPSLLARIDAMAAQADYFVALPGTLGTLVELAGVWNVAALQELVRQAPPMVLAYRRPWEAVVGAIVDGLGVPPHFRSQVRFVDGAAEATAVIEGDFRARCEAAAAEAKAAAADQDSEEGVVAGGAGAMPVQTA